jgi:hypothetical protein
MFYSELLSVQNNEAFRGAMVDDNWINWTLLHTAHNCIS